jgi:DNA repair protein RecO (recombination protein O)
MRIQDQAAYILHHRAYRDSSQILELFSCDYGRITVVSKGSLSAKSRTRARLQPFVPLLVGWSGKGDMSTLTASEVLSHTSLKLHGNALASAFYMNELLMKLLHKHDVHEDVFNLYKNTLVLLQDADALEKTLRIFEKKLLQMLGFGVNLIHDAETDEVLQADQHYRYYVEHGPVLSMSSVQDVRALRIKGSSLIAFEKESLDSAEALKDIKSLMRYVLAYYMEGKPIKSRELFR